VKFVFNT
jgi:50S ribosomal subunit-associated GTPase HflX